MGDDPLVELESRRLNRRQFLAASGLSLTAAAIAGACGPSTGTPASGSAATAGASAVAGASAGADPQKPVSLTFFHYATSNQEVVPKEITDQYMVENPHVTITLESGSNATTYPPLVAAYKTTGVPTINAGYFNAAASVQGDIDGLWQTLDPKRIPHLDDILEPYHRPGNKGVGWGLSVIGIPYRKDVQAPPTSWLDLLDPQFKGRVGLVDAPLYFFNGLYAINHVLGGTESNMDPGFAAFSEAAKAGQFAQIFQAEQLIDLFLSGAFDMAGFSYGNVAPAIQKGSPLAFAIPTEGVIAFPLFFQITNGSTPEQVYHSEQILDRLLAPEALARYAELTLTVPASTKVQLPASLASDPAFAIDTVSNAIQVDWKASAQNQAAFLDRWNREVKANLA